MLLETDGHLHFILRMHTLLYSLPNCNFFSCGKKKKEHVGKGKVTDMHDSCQVERECSECFSYRETCQVRVRARLLVAVPLPHMLKSTTVEEKRKS